MQFSGEKRKPLADISNECEQHQQCAKLSNEFPSDTFLPIPVQDAIVQQNLHPQLPFYKHDLITEHLSYDQLLQLLDPANDVYLIELLTSLGVIAVSQQCKFCGGPMRKFKEKIYWYWICTRRVNGVKCNRGKYSIRDCFGRGETVNAEYFAHFLAFRASTYRTTVQGLRRHFQKKQ